ncbi:MAG: XVIPCD domain-containing protein [Pseudomonadota bacterium]
MDRYTVTIHIAAPGTLLKDGKRPLPGHMYVVLSDGRTETSLGMAPASGLPGGRAKISGQDMAEYAASFYERTIEITAEQYAAMRSFGRRALDGEEARFRSYGLLHNSCVDFAWAVLHAGGLHPRFRLGAHGTGWIPDPTGRPSLDFDGTLKPVDNIEAIRSIPAPFPHSPLNRELQREPPRTANPFHWLLSDAVPARYRPLCHDCVEGVRRLDAGLGRAPDAASARLAGSVAVLAAQHGLQRVDAVLLSTDTAQARAGERVFAVWGDPQHPGHLRAGMRTAEAVSVPVETSVARLQAMLREPLATEAERRLDIAAAVAAPRMALTPG